MLKPPVAFAAAASLALALLNLGSASHAAPGQVVVGIVHPEDQGCGSGGHHLTLAQISSTSVSFVVPGAGVLTSWSTYANAAPGQARLLAFVPNQVGGLFNLVGKSSLTNLTPNTVNTFDARVPVPSGTLLGLYVSDDKMNCVYHSPDLGSGEVMGIAALFDPDANTILQLGATQVAQVPISAVWEPDVDADGYGDVTQDACPQSKLSQATCPAPDTKVKRKPKRVTTNRTVRMKLKSAAGATFTCAIDDRKPKVCASPLKRTLKYGKHIIVVTAVSAAGISDPTPVKIKVRIVRPR